MPLPAWGVTSILVRAATRRESEGSGSCWSQFRLASPKVARGFSRWAYGSGQSGTSHPPCRIDWLLEGQNTWEIS